MNRKTQTRASFEQFVRERSTSLGRTAFLLTNDVHHAEDLLQTALERAVTRWDRLDNPEAYVRRVLYTQAVSWWRSLRRRPAEALTGSVRQQSVPGGEVETKLLLRQALMRLTPRQRAVLVLRFYEDHSEAETARLLGCALGTVKSQTRHALTRLRALSPELADLIPDRPPVATPQRGARPAGEGLRPVPRAEGVFRQ